MIFKLDRSLFALISALTVVACRGEDPGTSDTDASTGGSTSSESASSTVAPTSTTGTPTTTDPGTTTTTGDPTMAGTTDPCAGSGGFIDCNSSSSGGGGPGENGAECADDSDCVSMNCYKNMFPPIAICAECNEDADCVAAGTGTAQHHDRAGRSRAGLGVHPDLRAHRDRTTSHDESRTRRMGRIAGRRAGAQVDAKV